MADITNLSKFLGDVANSIRTKKGTTDPIQPKNFDTEISTIDTSGLNTYDATATANDIAKGKTAYANGEKIEGTVVDNRGTADEPKSVMLANKTVTYTNSDNGYGGYMRVEMTPDESNIIDDTSRVTTDILGKVIADNIGLKSEMLAEGTTLLGVEGTHAALSTEELTITPTIEEQIYEGQFSKVTVTGDEDLIPENIREGKSIFGVTGNYVGNSTEYTELEYIESTGTQYIDTGIKLAPGYTVKLKFMDTGSSTNFEQKSYFGSLESTRLNRFRFNGGDGVFYVSLLNSTNYYSDNSYTPSDNTLYEIELCAKSGNQYFSVNGEKVYTATTTNLGSATCNALIFSVSNGGTVDTFSAMRLYYCQILDANDNLVRDFIPVLDGNGVVCLYDKTTGAYFYNQGTGSFIPGNGQVINYTMLYDYGDECTDVTGGWSFYGAYGSPTYSKNSNHIYQYPQTNRWSVIASQTANKISADNYSKLVVVADLDVYGDNGIFGASFMKNAKQVGTTYGDALFGASSSLNGLPGIGQPICIKNITQSNAVLIGDLTDMEGEGYVTLHTTSSTSNNRSIAKIYVVVLTTVDDWQTLASIAGITASSIDDILTNSTTLLSNEDATEFMIKQCTGDFMVSAIQSETFLTALNDSPYKTKIYANTHWAKFLTMIA